MRKIITFLLIGICFCKCTSNDVGGAISTSIAGDLILEIPRKMHLIEGKGIDSYVAYIVGVKADTIRIEYGRKGIIYSLISESPPVFPLSQKERIVKTGKEPSSDDVLFSEYADEDREERIFDKNYYMYDTINNIVVKLVQPKRIGNGVTGLFVPKLKDGKSLSIYARNLDSSANQRLLKIFKSMRYKS